MNRRTVILAALAALLAGPAAAKRGVRGCTYGRRPSGKCRSKKG